MLQPSVTPTSEILIVKRDRVVADAIAQAAVNAFPKGKIRLAHTGMDARAAIKMSPPRLAILGLCLPDLDGLDLLELIPEKRNRSKIVIVTNRRDEHTHDFLRARPIDGWFDSSADSLASLASALRSIAEGTAYFSPRIFEPNAESAIGHAFLARLTPMERLIFAILGSGKSEEDVAKFFHVAPCTVHSHKQAIMNKLSISNNRELMRHAWVRGVMRFTADGRSLFPGQEAALARRCESI